MFKCKICGEECVKATNQQAEEIINLIKDSKELAFLQTYPHYHPYCPNCGAALFDYSPEQIELLKNNSTAIKEIYADNSFIEIDPNKFALNCECAGYSFELAGLHREAAFAYAAAVDLLNLCLVKYLSNNKDKILEALGPNKDYSKLNDFEAYKLTMERIDVLKRLALGHVIESKSNRTDCLFLYTSLVIDFNKVELGLKMLDQLEDGGYDWLNDKTVVEIIKCLRNKAAAYLEATTIAIDVENLKNENNE